MKINKFFALDFFCEIKEHEKVTSRIDAIYLGSVEKNMDLFIVKSPTIKSGPMVHLSMRPNPNGAT